MKPRKSRILHLSTLVEHQACDQQVSLFRELFGQSVRVTPALCVKVASRFNWGWAARHLLSAPARAEYDRAQAAAWAEYDRAQAAAWAEYKRAQAPAFAQAYINDKG